MTTKSMTCAIAALTLFAGAASTATGQTFQRAIGDQSLEWHYSIANTRDGGYVTAGRRETSFALNQFHVVKYDAFGIVEWERTYGGERDDIAYSVQQTEDGGYIIAGETRSFEPGFEIALLRLDAAGGFVWANAYPGTFMTDPIHTPHPGVALDQTPEGRIYVVGNNAGFATLLTVGGGGGLLAANVYADPAGPNGQCQFAFTDVEYDEVRESVAISGTARYFSFDVSGDGTTGTPGSLRQDAFLFRTRVNGDPAGPLHLYDWPSDFTNPNEPNVWETGDGLDQLPDSSIVLAGRTDFGDRDGRSGTHLVFTDADFTPFWGRDYSTSFSTGIRANVETAYAAVEYDEQRDLFIQAGRIEAANAVNAHMQATDLSGLPIWAFAYGDQLFTRGESVQPKRTCGYAMTGHVSGFAAGGGGLGDIYLVKSDTSGKTGCLERDVFPEPITDPFCLSKDVESQPRQGQLTLPNVLNASDSNNLAFCFSDSCPDEPCTGPCNPADLAAPFCTLDIADVVAFLGLFGVMDPAADLAAPVGMWDIADVVAFLGLFGAGCP